MWTVIIVLVALLALAAGVFLGALGVIREQRQGMVRLDRDLSLARQECQALMSSIGRAGKMPISFEPKGPKVLERLDSYFDGKLSIEKVTAG